LAIFLTYLQAILEMGGVVAVGLALARVPLRWGIIAGVGAILVIIAYVIRSLPVPFGYHTIALLLLMIVFIAKATNVPLSRSFIVAITSLAILSLLEWGIHESLFFLAHTDLQTMISNEVLWPVTGFPQAVLMIIIALLINRFRKPLQGMWKI